MPARVRLESRCHMQWLAAKLRAATLRMEKAAKEVARLKDTTKKAILDHVATAWPTSPHQHDVMKRQTGPFTSESKPAFILSDTREAMFSAFCEKNPSIKISYSHYKKTLKVVAWNLKNGAEAQRGPCDQLG